MKSEDRVKCIICERLKPYYDTWHILNDVRICWSCINVLRHAFELHQQKQLAIVRRDVSCSICRRRDPKHNTLQIRFAHIPNVRICQLCVEAVGAEINYPPITTILRLEGKPVTNIPEFHLRCGGCRATMVSGNLEAGTAEGSSLSEAEVLQIFAEAAQKFTEGSVDHLRYQLCYHFLRENDGWTLIPPCEGLPWQQPQWFCPHCTKVIQAGIGDTLPEADKSQIITAMMQAANPIHHT